ncbi:MAG: tripartite tricarboxylate transporter permease [Armatimonadota bacterium]|nr:tripartite tricarboxylate transporter permease [Armatimonadota bacterium]MDR7519762.1 tripartite tricarboxylate transporter permease [Armatimonadota bacterium]MDR7549975.1 tripartite tricarboxylate transporter permease [Armatimonadota bacterium]
MLVEAFLRAFLEVVQWDVLSFMLIGVGAGFWVGLLPGLGGGTTLALMLPFVYRMQPVEAFAFLLGMHSVVATTGDITSILFGIPGEGTTAATILDGHAMAKKGEAGRALGAALASSLVGAIVGAGALLLAIPVVRPLVLTFGSPELFMLAVLGIAFIASLSGRRPRAMLRGFLAGSLGLLLAAVGQDPQAGNFRYTLGSLYLWDGLDLVPVLVGFFAIPEIIDLAVRGTAIAGDAPIGRLSGVASGVRDTFRHFWLTVRCSIIGTYIGVIPGLGGGVAQWVAYAHAVQSARPGADRDGFGKGDVRGVLGPGAANNSKEGGALVPTIAFGVPGSSAMAILLGAFLLVGLTPGPDMLTKHLNVTLAMVWTIVLANVVAVGGSLVFLNHLARLTAIRGAVLIPFLVLLTFIGAYTANNSPGDMAVMLLFGGLGYLMVRFRWPRAPLVLGFVLGEIAERYLWISVARYGAVWLVRPVVVALLLLTVGVIVSALVQYRRVAIGEVPP